MARDAESVICPWNNGAIESGQRVRRVIQICYRVTGASRILLCLPVGLHRAHQTLHPLPGQVQAASVERIEGVLQSFANCLATFATPFRQWTIIWT